MQFMNADAIYEAISHFRVVFSLSLCQNECKSRTFHMEMSPAFKFIFMQVKLIFIREVLREDLFNGRLRVKVCYSNPAEGIESLC